MSVSQSPDVWEVALTYAGGRSGPVGSEKRILHFARDTYLLDQVALSQRHVELEDVEVLASLPLLSLRGQFRDSHPSFGGRSPSAFPYWQRIAERTTSPRPIACGRESVRRSDRSQQSGSPPRLPPKSVRREAQGAPAQCRDAGLARFSARSS